MIESFIGPNGSGKTTAALIYARRIAARRGVPIYSNVAAEGVILITGYDMLASIRHAVVILDEVLAVAGSRESRSLPRRIQLWLTTLRHSDVILLWTSPSFERADVLLREVTRRAHVVHGVKTVRSRERLWVDTTVSIVMHRNVRDGQLTAGWPRLSFQHTRRHFGTFESHGDVVVFE